MKGLIIFGVVLILLGLLALAFDGVPISSKTESLNIGPIETTIKEERRLPMPPVFSFGHIGPGITLVVLGVRRPSPST